MGERTGMGMMTRREALLADVLGHLTVDYRIRNLLGADGSGNLLQAESVLDEIAGYEESKALREGWWIRPREDGTLDIRCWPDDPEGQLSASDGLAVIHVCCRARDGSPRHAHALAMVGRSLLGASGPSQATASRPEDAARLSFSAALEGEALARGYQAVMSDAGPGTTLSRFRDDNGGWSGVITWFSFSGGKGTMGIMVGDSTRPPPEGAGTTTSDEWVIDAADPVAKARVVHAVTKELDEESAPGFPAASAEPPTTWEGSLDEAYRSVVGSTPDGNSQELIDALARYVEAASLDDEGSCDDLRTWGAILVRAAGAGHARPPATPSGAGA